MSPERAETIALNALGWLAANEELLPVFLGSTGAGVEDLRDRVEDPAFLAGVLGFVTMNDDWVIAFCDHVGIGYDQPLRARYALPGARQEDWS
jgi:hypothetical protein